MNADELAAFISEIRAEAERALARLAVLDTDAMPLKLRKQYEEVKAGWEQLRAMTGAEAVELHEAACLEAGRELSADELRGLILRQ